MAKDSEDYAALVAAFQAKGGRVRELPSVSRWFTGVVLEIAPVISTLHGKEDRIGTNILVKYLHGTPEEPNMPEILTIATNQEHIKNVEAGKIYNIPVKVNDNPEFTRGDVRFRTREALRLPKSSARLLNEPK